MRKWSESFDMSSVPDAVLRSEIARRTNAMRVNKRGGRKRSDAPRCKCGAHTLARAAARAHKC